MTALNKAHLLDDNQLKDLAIDRIYDTLIDEDHLRICDNTIDEIADGLPARPYSSREFIKVYIILEKLSELYIVLEESHVWEFIRNSVFGFRVDDVSGFLSKLFLGHEWVKFLYDTKMYYGEMK